MRTSLLCCTTSTVYTAHTLPPFPYREQRLCACSGAQGLDGRCGKRRSKASGYASSCLIIIRLISLQMIKLHPDPVACSAETSFYGAGFAAGVQATVTPALRTATSYRAVTPPPTPLPNQKLLPDIHDAWGSSLISQSNFASAIGSGAPQSL